MLLGSSFQLFEGAGQHWKTGGGSWFAFMFQHCSLDFDSCGFLVAVVSRLF